MKKKGANKEEELVAFVNSAKKGKLGRVERESATIARISFETEDIEQIECYYYGIH